MKTRTLIFITILVLVVLVLCVGGEKWKISIINVFDDYIVNPDLKNSEGFGCVIKTPETDILFDTGYYPTGAILLSNMEKMNIDPKDIDIVVISHQHLDKGLAGFLKQNANVKVYVPASYPEYTRSMVEEYGAEYLEVSEFSEITENIYSTGAMEGKGYGLTEQSLVIDTEKGLVVIVGCAHPGIVDILKKIKEMLPDKDFYLVMGGFHLKSVSEAELESIIKEFKKLGVKKVAPSHCSGDPFLELSKREYKKNYIEGGVGQIISF